MPWEGPGLVAGTATPGTAGSICPQGWDEDFDRSQMSTQVLIARTAPSEIPTLRYTWSPAAATPPPATSTITLNNNQSQCTRMYIHRTSSTGDASIWVAYLNRHSTLSVASLGATPTQRGYAMTADVIEYPTYFELPIVWTDGDAVVPGPVDVKLSIGSEVPQLWLDPYGVNHYGRMTFSRTDLINTDRTLFEQLADRILEVRGSNSVPRLQTVTIDARTSRLFPMHNMELMSSASPEKPSRYRMRLLVGERVIYDRMCFATAVRHFVAPNEWTLRITLDIAEWAGTL